MNAGEPAGSRAFVSFVAAAAAICIFYAAAFTPVVLGDGGGYIAQAQQFAGLSQGELDSSDRQPLYALVLAATALIAGQGRLVSATGLLQWFLVFVNSLLVYRIFAALFKQRWGPAAAGLLYLANLSTMFYGYLILSETLGTFLFLVLAAALVAHCTRPPSFGRLAFMGLVCGLLLLARFSTFFVPPLVAGLLWYQDFFVLRRRSWAATAARVLVFAAPVVLIAALWSWRNHREHNFFFLFPTGGAAASCYTVLSCLEPGDRVSARFENVRGILLAAPVDDAGSATKGSLQRVFGSTMYRKIRRGWARYSLAEPALYEVFGLRGRDRNRGVLNRHLAPFFREIAAQHAAEITGFRFYSLLLWSSSSGSSLPEEYHGRNLNVLPPAIFLAYKLGFIGVSLLFCVVTALVLRRCVRLEAGSTVVLYVLLALIAYFPAVGFLTAEVYNINRYKFLAEPLMLGTLLYGVLFLRGQARGSRSQPAGS